MARAVNVEMQKPGDILDSVARHPKTKYTTPATVGFPYWQLYTQQLLPHI